MHTQLYICIVLYALFYIHNFVNAIRKYQTNKQSGQFYNPLVCKMYVVPDLQPEGCKTREPFDL